MEFIKLGVGASLALAARAAGAGDGPDSLASWIRKHRGEGSPDGSSGRIVVRPRLVDLPDALQELCDLADGALHGSGQVLTGRFRQRSFRVDVRPVGVS